MIDQALDGRARTLSARHGMRGVFQGLRRCGLSAEQAGNLTAHLEGIRGVPGGWSVEEMQRLRFARWLVASGMIGADDATTDPEGFLTPHGLGGPSRPPG